MVDSNSSSTEDNNIPNEQTAAQLSEIENLKKDVEKFKNDYLYLRAEFDNYRRNAVKERSDLMKYGSERIVVEILNVVDNFERALSVKVTPDSLETYIKGVEMTANELKQVLTKSGVSEVQTLGVAFDPSIHEALSSEETSEMPEGHIFRVFRKAYKFHDKVIRPAQVIVAKKQSVN